MHLSWGAEHPPPTGAGHPGSAEYGCPSTALHGPMLKALPHACACMHGPVHFAGACACLYTQEPGGCVLALTSMSPQQPVPAQDGDAQPSAASPRQPPATRGLVPGRLAELSSSCGDGKTRSEASAHFPFTATFRPCIPPHHPMSNRERPFPSGPTGDGATQGHPLAQEGSWQAARRRRVTRKQTLGFPVPLGSLGLFGVPE